MNITDLNLPKMQVKEFENDYGHIRYRGIYDGLELDEDWSDRDSAVAELLEMLESHPDL